MHSEKHLIEKCLKESLKAQKEFYVRFAKKMYGICLRYAKNHMDAEDVLQESFIKIFSGLKNFRFDGSLEGWVRQIVVNTSINHYRKALNNINELDINEMKDLEYEETEESGDLSAEEILCLIQELPDKYRFIFNLFAIEGYSHKEISMMLNIPENTSKSHLLRGRKMIQTKINQMKENTIV
jgi:RNA polymerase sigma factor (sigma-70 family)